MILASASPRRREILENFGFSLKVIIKNIEEISNKKQVEKKIMDIAQKKAMAVAVDFSNKNVVAADTVVVLNNEILGKPKDEKEAYKMLKKLSGKNHNVITAYSYINLKENKIYTDYDITKVFFKELTEKDIE